MPDLKRCVRLILSALAGLAVVLGTASCNFVRVSPQADDGPATLNLRIENATANSTDVTVVVDTGLAESVGVAKKSLVRAQTGIDGQPLEAESIVRVGPSDYSEGLVPCGRQVTVSATVGEGTQVQLSGDGSGTPGFDEGSVGLDGERFLIETTHYACGDTVVIRIEDDGTGVGVSTSSVGLGQITVYAAGQVPPVGDLPDLEPPEDPIEDEPVESVTAGITIENQTLSSINVELQVGTGDASTDELSNVTVVPLGVANGSVDCAQQITVRAMIVDAESGTVDAEPMLFQINLSGAGTGTVGFDEDTIGPGNSRILLQDQHFTCGDTILIVIFDDASNIDETEGDQPRIGSGSIIVMSAGS